MGPCVSRDDGGNSSALLRRNDARRQDCFEMLGTVAVDLEQEFIGYAAKLPAQLARHHGGIELGALAHDRLDGVDVMGDQFRRDQLEVGRMLDDAAEALGGGGRGREAEGGGVALDVMGGAELFFAVLDGEAVAENDRMGSREAVRLDRHPVLEFAGQSGERLFRPPDRIVEV